MDKKTWKEIQEMVKPVHHVAGDDQKDTDILISVILDRSGSMGGLETDVIGHYNKFIKDQRKLPGKALVSLTIFDTEYTVVYSGKDINEVPELTKEIYFARGSTALLDAIGRTINSVDAIKNKPNKVLFLINTDGHENSSHEFSRAAIKELITERQNNHGWEFLFIGAGLDAFADGQTLGLNSWQTFTSSPTAVGMSNTAAYAGSVTSAYRTTGVTGQALYASVADSVILEEDASAPSTAGSNASTIISNQKRKRTKKNA